MKRTFKTILCVAAVVMASVSCQKSAEPVQTAEEGKETIDICVNGLMGEYTQVDATKAELVNTVRVSWKGGETVYVYDGSKCIGSLVASLEGDEDRYAVLSTDGGEHQIEMPAQGTKILTLVYSPLLTEKQELSGNELYISLEAQSGEKAPFVAYATLEYNGETTITGTVVPFKFATSVIKVNCTGLKAGTAIDHVTLSNVNTNCLFQIFEDAVFVSGAANGTITRTGDAYFAADKVNAEGEAVFQIAVPQLLEVPGARVLTVAQGSDEVKDKKFTTKSLAAATSVNTVCQLVGLPAGALKGEFSVSDTKKVYFSKGNLWADGDNALHFEDAQWKTTPASNGSKDASHVSHFTWSSTVAAAVGESNSGDYLFCDESHKVSVDGGEAIYYALSQDEWSYLFNNHSKKWASVGGVNGYVIAPDGFSGELSDTYANDAALATNKLVFLPAAGARGGSDVYDVGNGHYWSSTFRISNIAYDVYFSSKYVILADQANLFTGYSVRLITESN